MRAQLHRYLARTLPEPSKVLLYRIYQSTNDCRLSLRQVEYRSSLDNIYHCAVHKTASQWVKKLVFDPTVYSYSGLKPWTRRVQGIDLRRIQDRRYDKPFPKKRLITTLYMTYENFRGMPKPDKYRAFMVIRDPRDIVVSAYFSLRFSHTPMGGVLKQRERLSQLSLEEGLCHTIGYLRDFGLFHALRSWTKAADQQDPNIIILKYEDLTGSKQSETVNSLLEFCDVGIQTPALRQLLSAHSFSNMHSAKDGEIAPQKSHYRKGQAGDWKHSFSPKVKECFCAATNDLVTQLGYDETNTV